MSRNIWLKYCIDLQNNVRSFAPSISFDDSNTITRLPGLSWVHFPLDYNADIHEDQYVKFYGRLVLYILTLCLIRLRDKLLIQEENHTLRGLEFERSL